MNEKVKWWEEGGMKKMTKDEIREDGGSVQKDNREILIFVTF